MRKDFGQSCHYHTTGREIIEQMKGLKVDAFVSVVGTGGTLMGVRQALREVWPDSQMVAVEPDESAVISGSKELSDQKIAGIEAGYIPELLDTAKLSRIVRVKSDAALAMARKMAKHYGLMVGASAGANVLAAIEVLRALGKDKRVVKVFPDRAEQYFSTDLISSKHPQAAISACTRNCENPFCEFNLSISSQD